MTEHHFYLRKARDHIKHAAKILGRNERNDAENDFCFKESQEIIDMIERQMDKMGIEKE